MLIAQFSDCHIVDPGEPFADRVDSAAGLRAAVETMLGLAVQPDLVVLTGDLVNDGTAVQYRLLREILSDVAVPMVPVCGNHDDRRQLRAHFPDVLAAGGPDESIDYVHDAGEIRLVVLDTSIPGRHDGRLQPSQLEWLDATLGAEPDRPTIVAQHHPPLSSGITWMDDVCGFPDGTREAAVIRRHPQIEAVVSGHLHRSFSRKYAGTVAITCPSTACALDLGLAGGPVEYTSQPTGFIVHHWRADHGLVSHDIAIGRFDSWSPSWNE